MTTLGSGVAAAIAAICMATAGAIAAHGQDAAPRIAIADIYYLDTSGEPGDRDAEHAARITLFETELGKGLAERTDYQVETFSCGMPECSVGTLSVEKAVEAAAARDVDYLLLGAVQKVSTLVGMGRVDIIDVKARKDVFSRVLSFRGDTDEAFVRVADFVVTNVAEADFDAAHPGPRATAGR
ncbi:DUF2380 domain-containing protein [Aurantimonas sp. A2-1-M11]|uniref:DUF2380 domain-containing protein n=1 Tax=Aurantimonas sp. A2-1-M11 TaxID=3113712 RepID=UPI002F950683